ncbi:MAG: hypothetical protein KDD43_14015 [Bdellovibrionales bacterium]|nr:hypothetical protein [Bdellovibrionales bacterium]
MKGLIRYPQTEDLAKAIHVLQTGREIETTNLALFSQWSRLDPRVGEVLVQFVFHHWREIEPLSLNQELHKQPWPAAMGVILEFVDLQLKSPDRSCFRHWAALVMNGVTKQSGWPQFFHGFRSLGGKLMLDDARFSLSPYRKWGFVSQELLVKTDKKLRRNPWSKEVRLVLLRDLLQRQKRIRIAEYLQLLHYQISTRQAERDLAELKGVHSTGNTKARIYSYSEPAT